ncbi:MAG: RHS repeat-associated core domain-containing protein [Burkholderiales bacterium]|jgi:RHS repeat-associated protein|nr:RHS repeat-associated core domain-containing protein [Burkholderiales bacterium]MCA3165095.1 RHS repeat-associated core domain-containing protein [Burkholderiales bacterium]MCA3170245.1 RHS repeat-associated core domain-containing protein [Burkholderiales bacterium]MCA3171783.1 RHS repeat-associated core domain-containing protein [Burkholderiales bacterium]
MTGLNLDEMLARVTTLNATNTTQARTYLTDALGSVIAQTQDNQSTLAGYSYSPYGQTQSTGNTEGDSVQYTGRENDHNGLYYYRARYYDPVLKRFLSEDPIGLAGGSLSFYSYVEGNPVQFVDPEGKLLTIGGGIAVGLGAYGGYSLFKKYQRERQCAQECKLQCENNVACGDPDRSQLYEANALRWIAGCIPLCVGEFMGGPKKGPIGPQPPSQTPDYIKYRHYPK